jgi:hypothetical protein
MNVLNLSENRVMDNPDDARAWQARAVALMWLGRTEEADLSRNKALEVYEREARMIQKMQPPGSTGQSSLPTGQKPCSTTAK